MCPEGERKEKKRQTKVVSNLSKLNKIEPKRGRAKETKRRGARNEGMKEGRKEGTNEKKKGREKKRRRERAFIRYVKKTV